MNFVNYRYLNLNTLFSNFYIIDKKTYLNYILIKYKRKFHTFYIPNNIYIYNLKKSLVILTSDKEKLNLYIKSIKTIIFSNFFKYMLKIELYGVGYRAFIKSPFIYFILGYSHIIKIKIPVDCEIILGINGKLVNFIYYNIYILGNLFHILYTLKSVDIYKGKGIRNIYKQLKLKLGKIKNSKK